MAAQKVAPWPSTAIVVAGQRVLSPTVLFGKSYFWMQDHDGTTYLLPNVDGVPSFG